MFLALRCSAASSDGEQVWPVDGGNRCGEHESVSSDRSGESQARGRSGAADEVSDPIRSSSVQGGVSGNR